MTDKRHGDPEFIADDEFLTALSRGEDPSHGSDALAGLLLHLKTDVDAPMPPAPRVDTLGRKILGESPETQVTQFRAVKNLHEEPAQTVLTSAAGARHAQHSAAGNSTGADVFDLAEVRSRRRSGWLRQSLIGAAAATLVIAGGGAAVYNAQPGDALWDANVALFGNHASVVQLASLLEEADNRSAQGDVDGAREVLEQAKNITQDIDAKEHSKKAAPAVTVTKTVPAPVPVSAPLTVTVTQTVVQVVPRVLPTVQPGEPTDATTTEDAPTQSTNSESPTTIQPTKAVTSSSVVAVEPFEPTQVPPAPK